MRPSLGLLLVSPCAHLPLPFTRQPTNTSSFNLNVTVSPSTSATCGARVESNEDLPDLNSTACSGAPVSFSFKHVDGGANLEINWGYAVGRNLSGTHFVPDSQIVYTNTQVPTGTVQTYEGPADFAITDLQNIAVL